MSSKKLGKEFRLPRTSRIKSPRMRIAALLALELVAIIGLLFVFRGFIRETIIPQYFQARYADRIDEAANTELRQLDLANLTKSRVSEVNKANCAIVGANDIRESVSCTKDVILERPTQGNAEKTLFTEQLTEVRDRAKAEGWQESRFDDPPAGYGFSKNIGNIRCGFELSDPGDNEQMITYFSCYIDGLNFIGNPEG